MTKDISALENTPLNAGWTQTLMGRSVEGQDIVFYLNQKDMASGQIDTLFFSAIHGDERESFELAQHFMMTVNPDQFEGKIIGWIPMLNPDGFAKNQRMNARGVDLNRNFPTRDWAELNPETIYYSGPSAASEPETQFLLTVLTQFPPQKIVTIHTPYKVINYDGPAKALADAMARENGYPVVEDIGYATPGSFGTYVGKERHIPTITLELPEENFDAEELARNSEALRAAIHYQM